MSFYRVFAIILRQFYIVRGSFARMFPLFAWAGVDMILWGFLTRYLNSVSSPGFNFVPALLGAVLLWDFFIRIMQGVTMRLDTVWANNFHQYFCPPRAGIGICHACPFSILTSAIGLRMQQ
jgi:ABC-2 type transport system permease protein